MYLGPTPVPLDAMYPSRGGCDATRRNVPKNGVTRKGGGVPGVPPRPAPCAYHVVNSPKEGRHFCFGAGSAAAGGGGAAVGAGGYYLNVEKGEWSQQQPYLV